VRTVEAAGSRCGQDQRRHVWPETSFQLHPGEARVLLSPPEPPNAAETNPKWGRIGFICEATQKKPLCCNSPIRASSGCKISSTGSRKHAVHQSARDPFPRVASRGQVSKVTSSIRSLQMHAARHEFILCFQDAPSLVWGGRRLGLCQCDTISGWLLVAGSWWLVCSSRASHQPPATFPCGLPSFPACC
jgi:hypothetical protein